MHDWYSASQCKGLRLLFCSTMCSPHIPKITSWTKTSAVAPATMSIFLVARGRKMWENETPFQFKENLRIYCTYFWPKSNWKRLENTVHLKLEGSIEGENSWRENQRSVTGPHDGLDMGHESSRR